MEIQIDPEAGNAAAHVVKVSSELPEAVTIAVGLAGVSIVLFVLFVLPIWLLLHYRSRSLKLVPEPAPQARTVSSEDLADLLRLAERIEHRLDAVETLMDAERPHWRK